MISQSEFRVLGLLPARGGSKGIPGKNLRPLLGRPLICWAASALAKASLVDLKICSTDDERISLWATKSGLEVPWLRPGELAADDTLVVDVIGHALRALSEEAECSFSHVALVQATSPTITPGDIDRAVKLALDSDADTVITGFNAGQRHPSTMYTISSDGGVDWLLVQDHRMARRQDLSDVFIRTGLVYVIKSKIVLEQRSIYGERIVALEVPEERSVTIDEEFDFKIAELILNGELK